MSSKPKKPVTLLWLPATVLTWAIFFQHFRKIQEQEGQLRATVNYGEGQSHSALSVLINSFAIRFPKK